MSETSLMHRNQWRGLSTSCSLIFRYGKKQINLIQMGIRDFSTHSAVIHELVLSTKTHRLKTLLCVL